MEVKCPRCGNVAKFTPENPFRPFCSERCKLIDLGAWAEGKYSVPVASAEDDVDEEVEGTEPIDVSETPDSGDDDGPNSLH